MVTSSKLQLHILLSLILLTTLFLRASKPAPVDAQEPENAVDLMVEAIFNVLTPNERVGQLFMVSFEGADVGLNSEIAELIQDYRIGGVMLSATNKNFINNDRTPGQVLTLTNALQALAQAKLTPSPGDNQGGLPTPTVTSTITSTLTGAVDISYTPLPLFIAVAHEGDGYPYTQIRGGLIDVPNQMALGATWNPENARLVGEVVGRQLSLLGINVLLGPSLDVLDNPRPERGGLLGTRTFGGHPYWVGQMGQAYIRGIHQGSDHQVLTIAKHFPGFGSSDRAINQGVPTILKSLDDLRRTELAPFFKVTHFDPDQPEEVVDLTDGLMTAHVRYQGLQGNVPISLDARNLPALLALKEIAPWHQAGGVVVSAPLGAPAALEGIAAGRENFPARRLAQDAFLAGSDILLLADFAFKDSSPADELMNIKNSIEFFREKYASDPNFQAAVDKAVRRIIKNKIKIYGENLLTVEAQKPLDNLTLLNRVSIDLNQIAQAGVTLITPITQAGLTPLSISPQPGDNILIFTDDRLARDCPDCPEFRLIGTNALQEIILQLFGPNATGQILPEQITSLSFVDLKAFADEAETSAEVEPLIQAADWIIFAMLDIDVEAYPQSDAVRDLLRNRYDALRNKNLVLFAFNAPYFLGETEISQLTAYYGFYGKSQSYLETAAKLLFQQFEPSGASPVSIPAIGPLNLSPDPDQIIQLEPIHKIDTNGNIIPLSAQAQPVTTLDLKVGEGILFRTGVIMDRNGHPVPDKTSVDFFRFYPLEGLSLEPLTASTVNGVAEITIYKERDTPLQIRASSNLAVQSVTFNIGPGIVDTPTPTPTLTPTPTDTPRPTDTPSPTPTEMPVATVEITPTAEIPSPLPPGQPLGDGGQATTRPVNFVDLAYSLLGMVVIGGIAFTLGGDRFSLEERIRPALVAVAVGLVGYILYAMLVLVHSRLGYGGLIVEQGATGHWVAPLLSILFAIVGTVAWFLKPGRIFGTNQQGLPHINRKVKR